LRPVGLGCAARPGAAPPADRARSPGFVDRRRSRIAGPPQLFSFAPWPFPPFRTSGLSRNLLEPGPRRGDVTKT